MPIPFVMPFLYLTPQILEQQILRMFSLIQAHVHSAVLFIVIDIRNLGCIIRSLKLNPSQTELSSIISSTIVSTVLTAICLMLVTNIRNLMGK